MLVNLSLKNFVLADTIDIEFDQGLSTITGESGAGKSMLIKAIALLIGARADETQIKSGYESAEIQAQFSLTDNQAASNWLKENDLDDIDETNYCLIRRRLTKNKPSKAFINGVGVTLAQLRALGQLLIDMHGQNEHHLMLDRTHQKALLDQMGGASHHKNITQLSTAYEQIQTLEHEVNTLKSDQNAHQERHDLLSFYLNEFNELNVNLNDWHELESQYKKINHQQELQQQAYKIYQQLLENDSAPVTDQLQTAIAQLQPLIKFDPALESIIHLLEEARIQTQEAGQRLRPYFESETFSEEEKQLIVERFDQYVHLARKHKINPEALYDYYLEVDAELQRYRSPEETFSELERKLDQLKVEYHSYAEKISKVRQKQAKTLSASVTQVIQTLGMKNGEFVVALDTQSNKPFSRSGYESIEFRVKTHQDSAQSLAKVASGGELSRISLALQVASKSEQHAPCLIFDEVDVGISGQIAEVVGQLLHTLSRKTQILCITHLPQVAAQGDNHYQVQKQFNNHSKKPMANTDILKLDKQQRITAIAEMQSGQTPTPASLALAEEMLQQARA